ncbi:MAG: aspartyl protease family protein [Gammaproteobacteria bacterium]
MGIVRAQVDIKNPRLPDAPFRAVNMLVDSGSHHLCIPESLREELDLEIAEHKAVVLADGRAVRAPYAGPIQLRFKNRIGYAGALVMGDEPLLGVIPMEDMDLVVLPKEERLDVNPEHPDIAGALAKGGGGI